MCFSKTLSPRLRTIIQVILISILYVLARMVFFQAHLLKKKKKKQIGHNLVPTYKIFVAFSLCTSQNKLKTKGYEEQRQKSKNNIRVALCQKTAGKNTSHSKNGTIFKRWQKWPFCKGYSKAKWSQMVYTGTEPQNTKNIQKLPFKIIRVVLCRKLLKNTLNIRKMTRR